MYHEEERTINSCTAGRFAQGAAIDVERRNAQAYKAHQEFFDDPEHNARVEAARAILDKFFAVKDIYENQRGNKGNPFTVLKVTNHVFPRVSFSEKARRYRKPLEELGVEITFAKGSNSYLYHIK